MFRMLSPWDGRAWMRPADDEAYPFAAPLHQLRSYEPFENFEIDDEHPVFFPHPAYRARSRPPTTPTAFVPCGYPHPPRRTSNLSSAAPPSARRMYDRLDELPYGFHYPLRPPAAREPGLYPARPHIPAFRVVSHQAAGDDDTDAYGHIVDDQDAPKLLNNGYGYMLKRPQLRQPLQQRQQHQEQQQAAGGQHEGAMPASAAIVSGSDADDGHGNGHNDDNHHNGCNRTDAGPGGISQRHGMPSQPALYWDPWTGLYFRAMPSANGTGNGDRMANARPTEMQPKTSRSDASTSNDNTTTAAAAAVAAAARPATSATGPTRIEVRAADGSHGAGAAKVPVTAAAPVSSAKEKEPKTVATSAAVAPGATLEGQHSTALVTRPSMEISLSRGPSAVLPSAVSSASASATASASSRTTTSVDSSKAASSAPNSSASAVSVASPTASAAGAAAAHSQGPFATTAAAIASPTAFVHRMTGSQAARTIQRWWRGWRLWRHSLALRQLMALARALRETASRYYGYLGATDDNLTTKQQFEINELAMRAILKLDSLEGLPPEFRALRKHLTARALRLQDQVQSAFARSSASSSCCYSLSTSPAPTSAHQELEAAPEVTAEATAEARSGDRSVAPLTVVQPEAAAAATATAASEPHCEGEDGHAATVDEPQEVRLQTAEAAVEAAVAADKTPVPSVLTRGSSLELDGAFLGAGLGEPYTAGGEDNPQPSVLLSASEDVSIAEGPQALPPPLAQQQQQQQPPPAQQHVHVHLHVSRRPRLTPRHRLNKHLQLLQQLPLPPPPPPPQRFMAVSAPAAAAMTTVAAAACGRTARNINKRATTAKRVGSGGSRDDGSCDAARGLSSGPGGLVGGGISGQGEGLRLLHPQRRRQRGSVQAEARAATTIRGSHGLDPSVRLLRRMRKQQEHGLQQQQWEGLFAQQQQQHPSVVLRIVVCPGEDGDGDGVGCGRGYRTALFVDAGVQTD